MQLQAPVVALLRVVPLVSSADAPSGGAPMLCTAVAFLDKGGKGLGLEGISVVVDAASGYGGWGRSGGRCNGKLCGGRGHALHAEGRASNDVRLVSALVFG